MEAWKPSASSNGDPPTSPTKRYGPTGPHQRATLNWMNWFKDTGCAPPSATYDPTEYETEYYRRNPTGQPPLYEESAPALNRGRFNLLGEVLPSGPEAARG
jgi:hypothetical protein